LTVGHRARFAVLDSGAQNEVCVSDTGRGARFAVFDSGHRVRFVVPDSAAQDEVYCV